jgi:hypothetical protein|tara:strand:- start:140 stop:424 length:285 start_codon:yes stop_codon:yes gene_type:complete
MNHLRDKAKLLLKNDIGEYMLDKITSGVSAATQIAMSLIGLTILLQIVFGGSVAFLGGDVIGTIIGIVSQLGDAGLVGLISAAVLWKLLTHDDA